VIQKNVPKNLQNPEKNTKKIENTSRLKKTAKKIVKIMKLKKYLTPKKKNQQKNTFKVSVVCR